VLPKVYALARAHGIGPTLDAAAGESFQHLIEPSGQARFPLVILFKGGRDRDLDVRAAILFMWWRKSALADFRAESRFRGYGIFPSLPEPLTILISIHVDMISCPG
jgi:hypothetical protein